MGTMQQHNNFTIYLRKWRRSVPLKFQRDTLMMMMIKMMMMMMMIIIIIMKIIIIDNYTIIIIIIIYCSNNFSGKYRAVVGAEMSGLPGSVLPRDR